MVFARDSSPRTALHWAINNGHAEIVHVLLAADADAGAEDQQKSTPLHSAIINEHVEVTPTPRIGACMCVRVIAWDAQMSIHPSSNR